MMCSFNNGVLRVVGVRFKIPDAAADSGVSEARPQAPNHTMSSKSDKLFSRGVLVAIPVLSSKRGDLIDRTIGLAIPQVECVRRGQRRAEDGHPISFCVEFERRRSQAVTSVEEPAD